MRFQFALIALGVFSLANAANLRLHSGDGAGSGSMGVLAQAGGEQPQPEPFRYHISKHSPNMAEYLTAEAQAVDAMFHETAVLAARTAKEKVTTAGQVCFTVCKVGEAECREFDEACFVPGAPVAAGAGAGAAAGAEGATIAPFLEADREDRRLANLWAKSEAAENAEKEAEGMKEGTRKDTDPSIESLAAVAAEKKHQFEVEQARHHERFAGGLPIPQDKSMQQVARALVEAVKTACAGETGCEGLVVGLSEAPCGVRCDRAFVLPLALRKRFVLSYFLPAAEEEAQPAAEGRLLTSMEGKDGWLLSAGWRVVYVSSENQINGIFSTLSQN